VWPTYAYSRYGNAFTVEETVTTLTLGVNRGDGGETGEGQREIDVSGSLTTESGTPIPGQSVTLTVGGTVVGTVETGSNGEFETRLKVPDSQLPSAVGVSKRLVVTASYAGSETNLGAATADSVLLVRSELLATVARTVLLPRTLLAFALLGFAVVARRQYDSALADPEANADATDDSTGEEPPADPATTPTMLATAQQALGSDRLDAAILFGYASARATVETEYDIDSNLTHWEYYDACRRAGVVGGTTRRPRSPDRYF
jgi:hypothetical protein